MIFYADSETVKVDRVSEFTVSHHRNTTYPVGLSYDGVDGFGETVALTVYLTETSAIALHDALGRITGNF